MDHPDSNGWSIKTFATNLKSNSWIVPSSDVSYPDLGNSIASSCWLILGIHLFCAANVEPLLLKHPLQFLLLLSLDSYGNPSIGLRIKFHWPTMTLVLQPRMDPQSQLHCLNQPQTFPAACTWNIIFAMLAPITPYWLDWMWYRLMAYALHSMLAQTWTSSKHISKSNSTLMATHIIRAISPFKFVHCFGFTDQLTYCLSQPPYKFSVDTVIPAHTSAWLIEQVHAHLVYLRDSNCKIFSTNQFAAPAATIQAFVNDAIGVRLPSHEKWAQAHSDNPEMSIIRNPILNPSKINTATLNLVNYNFRAPLRQSLIFIENGMLFCKELIRGGSSYTCLQLVPQEFYNILFIAFHSNLIGRHMNAFRNLHRFHLRYYWPWMYSYIKPMCNACPGCTLANPTKIKSSKLV